MDGSIRVRLARCPGGFHLSYDDTGTFDVLSGGRRIEWSAGPRAVDEAVRLDILGRVLPLAMHMQGTLTLHGSAVDIGGCGVAFLAPKRHGKSTLARALLQAGARLLTDDVAAVDLSPLPSVRCGVQELRLWPDAAERFDADVTTPSGICGKVTVTAGADAQSVHGAAPLAAICILAPVRDGERVRRVRMPAVPAAMALVAEARLAALLGREESAVLLDRAVRLSQLVPVYRLEIARDLGALPSVAEQIMRWYAPAAPQAVEGVSA